MRDRKTPEEVIDAWIDPCGSDTGSGILYALRMAGYEVVEFGCAAENPDA